MRPTAILTTCLALAYLGMLVSPARWAAWQVALAVSLVGCSTVWLSLNRPNRQTGLPVAALMSLLSLVCLVTLLLMKAPTRFEGASDFLLSQLWPEQQRPQQWLEKSTRRTSPQAGNWLWNEHSIRPLPRRTNLKPGNQPEVFLQLDRAEDAAMLLRQRAYLSAFSLGRYEHAAWAITPAADTPAPSPPSAAAAQVSYEVFHPSDPSGQTPLIALQGLVQTSTPYEQRGDGIRLLPAQPSSLGYRYRATSQPRHLDEMADVPPANRRPELPRDYLTLPTDPTFLPALQEKILSRCAEGTVKQRLQSLRRILQEECDYSLIIENPQNRDPLVNFLFHEKKGHCEMFATAAAMAARAMGIPSRIAYGWVGGSFFEPSRLWVFRAREAHAWTELWIEGTGWVMLDATPPQAIGRSRAAPADEKPLTAQEMAASPELDYADSAAPTWLSWALATSGLSAAALSLWLRARRPLHASHLPLASSAESRLRGYETPLLAWCHRQGVFPAPHWTLREVIAALPSPPACAEELCRYHYATRYGTQPRSLTLERRFARQLRQQSTGDHDGSRGDSSKNGNDPRR